MWRERLARLTDTFGLRDTSHDRFSEPMDIYKYAVVGTS
jgi:hypothetical protein